MSEVCFEVGTRVKWGASWLARKKGRLLTRAVAQRGGVIAVRRNAGQVSVRVRFDGQFTVSWIWIGYLEPAEALPEART